MVATATSCGARGFLLFGGAVARDLTFAEQAMAKELVLLMGVAAAREYRDVLKPAREQGRDGKAGLEQDLTGGHQRRGLLHQLPPAGRVCGPPPISPQRIEVRRDVSDVRLGN